MCEKSRAKGRVLNATGYHIKKAERLTRYKAGELIFAPTSAEPGGGGEANTDTQTELLKLFMPRGKTARDAAASAAAAAPA